MHFATHHSQSPDSYEQQRSNNALIQHRKDLLLKTIHNYLPKSVLDLGCGTGGIVADIARNNPGIQFYGYDPETRFIEFAQQNFVAPNLSYVSEMEPVGQVDLIYSIDVLHHIENWNEFIPQVTQHLNRQGRWLVIEPNSYNPYIYLLQRRPGEKPFDRKLFRRSAEESGLKFDREFYYHLWPSGFQSVQGLGKSLEGALERIPFLGGSIVQLWGRS